MKIDNTFLIISSSILLRTRNVSSYRENQNTHFMFDIFFPKIFTLMRLCEKKILLFRVECMYLSNTTLMVEVYLVFTT